MTPTEKAEGEGIVAWLTVSERDRQQVAENILAAAGGREMPMLLPTWYYVWAMAALKELPRLTAEKEEWERRYRELAELPELPPELVAYWRKLTARQQDNLLSLVVGEKK